MRRGWALSGLGVAAVMVAGCGGQGSASASPKIVVSPASSVMDQPLTIRLSGLQPGLTTLRLTSTDAHGKRWTSSARFVVAGNGVLDVATAASVGGSYRGVHPMGLVWGMTPSPPSPGRSQLFWWGSHPQRFTLTATRDRAVEATAGFARSIAAPGVDMQTETLAGQGFVGQLWSPPPGKRRGPAVLAFGGSEGGLDAQLMSAALASAGHPTLNVAYFGMPGLPATLADIPLEYFARALRWLGHQPGVDPASIDVVGASRGSEAALLLGAYFPSLVHGVIAAVPSNVAVCSYPGCHGPAWTLHGRPLLYTRQVNTPHPTDDPAAVIPVQRLRGPLLLVCGGADKVWHSCAYARAIEEELTAAHDGYPHPLYAYPDAGHGVGSLVPYEPNEPDIASAMLSGATPAANQVAKAAAWPHVLAFLG